MSINDLESSHIALPKWVPVQTIWRTEVCSNQKNSMATSSLKIISSGCRETRKRYGLELSLQVPVQAAKLPYRRFCTMLVAFVGSMRLRKLKSVSAVGWKKCNCKRVRSNA